LAGDHYPSDVQTAFSKLWRERIYWWKKLHMVDLEEQKIACKPRRVKKMPMKISYGVHQSIEFPCRLEQSSLAWTAEFGG
jgi:hypothetical protein